MTCPKCNGPTRVMDSMALDTGDQINRIRVCVACGWKFRTVEVEYDGSVLDWVKYDYADRKLVNLNRRKYGNR